MSVKSKLKLSKDMLSQFKQAFGMNNAQIGAIMASPSSLRTKAIATAIGTPLKNYLEHHAKGATAKKLIAKVSVAKIGNAIMYLDAANAGTQTLRNILPTVAKAADWTMALPFNVLNQTLGRIPGIGKFFRAIHNFITEGVSKVADIFGLDSLAETGYSLKLDEPEAGFETNINWGNNNKGDEDMPKSTESRKRLINAPSFYENLDLHKTFAIPGAYTKKTVINGTMATPKIAVHRVIENPMPDRSATIDRLNQKFSLIKAVRGLSATVYNIVDLYNYERFAKLNLLEYYVIKKVVQAAKTYSLVQTQIGDNIMTSLGFDPTEVRDNLANYETLLCQIHRFIANNLPISGTWIKRLEYLVGANVPDYSDPKVATIHMFAVSMNSVFYDRKEVGASHVFDCIPEANNNNYAILLSNFTTYQADIVNNDAWQQLIADYFGAFGAQAMWEDKDYPAYAKPLDLRNSDNDLCREQIKNALYLNAKVELITINAGVANKKIIIDVDDPTPVQFKTYQFPDTFTSSNYASVQQLSYANILDYDTYMNVSSGLSSMPLGSTNKLLLPDHNGVGAQRINITDGVDTIVSMNNHETIYTLHKDNYSEGEALEISQFKARSVAVAFRFADATDTFYVNYLMKTQEYGLLDTTVYVFGSNGSSIVEQNYRICDEVISDDDLTDVESAIDFPDEMMCWALIDWMPLVHFTFYGYNSSTTDYSPRDIACIDMDSFGSLDDRAFATSINYSVYSLQAAGLVVGKKRVDNLGAIYKDKPSKRG